AGGEVVEPWTPRWESETTSALRRVATQLTASGGRLVMLTPMTVGRQASSACLRNIELAACGINRDPGEETMAGIYRRSVAGLANVEVIPGMDLFCDQRCPFAINGTVLRYDGNHFTADGGRLFVERLD